MNSYDPLHDCKLIGASRAICGIRDSAVILHSRPGCQSGAALLRALGSQQDDIKIICSGLKGKEMALGGAGRVAAAVKATWEHLNPGLIVVFNCSAPAIMGDDVQGALTAIEEEVGAETLALNTAGYEGPDWMGYEEALASLVQFMGPSAERNGKVNLIGFKDDTPCAQADLWEIKRMLNGQGIGINTVLTSCCFDDIRKVPEASLNVVLGGDGLLCANTIEEKFGLPKVVVPYPFGINNSLRFLEEICAGLGRKVDPEIIVAEREKIKAAIERIYFHLQGLCGLPVAVVGEAGRAWDFGKFTNDELGLDVKTLVISSKNHLDWEKKKKENLFFGNMLMMPDKFEMDQEIVAAGVELIFGSTMERKLAHDMDAGLMRISFPVIDAVSISDSPYAGFRGVPNLVETMINTVISRYEKVEKQI